MKGIKTIIFDLGGVIIDLDVSRTIDRFSSLSGLSHQAVTDLYLSHPAFTAFEKGQIDERLFRSEIRKLFRSEAVSDDDLDAAWNAMLVALPAKKIDLLHALRERYQVMILSNTNVIHIDHVCTHMLPAVCEMNSFESIAHKVYYSHLVGLRKPEPAIYERVLDENDLRPEQTVFLDDNSDNIRAAGALGINVQHILHPDNVFEIFN